MANSNRMTMKQMIRLEQAQRMEKFPDSRIPFYSSETAAVYDRFTFRKYMEDFKSGGFRVLTNACREIEHNNYLPVGSISEERFLTVAKSLGYDPYMVGDDYEEDEDE